MPDPTADPTPLAPPAVPSNPPASPASLAANGRGTAGSLLLSSLLAVVIGSGLVLGTWIFLYGWPAKRTAHVDGGSIFVHGPQVYTRERLVNDRYQEDSWLNGMLERSTRERFGYTASRASTSSSTRSVGLNATAGLPGAPPSPAPSQPPLQTQPKTVNPPADGLAAIEFSEQPTFRLQATRAYREQIRTMLIENQLDDRHDLHGNTLYRLRFDATILPNEGSQAAAQIEILIDPPALNSLPEAIQKGAPSLKQFNEWIDAWRDLYFRWGSNLELRLEEEAVTRTNKYENGRFGPDDYDMLLGRLRSSVLLIAKDIDETQQRFEKSHVQLEPPTKTTEELTPVERTQLKYINAMRSCLESTYKRAGEKLAELKGSLPDADKRDPVVVNHAKDLREFREAFVRGVTTNAGIPIEQLEAHAKYRDRINELLYLRRTLVQLTDTGECDKIPYQAPIAFASTPLQRVGAVPAPATTPTQLAPAPDPAPAAAPGQTQAPPAQPVQAVAPTIPPAPAAAPPIQTQAPPADPAPAVVSAPVQTQVPAQTQGKPLAEATPPAPATQAPLLIAAATPTTVSQPLGNLTNNAAQESQRMIDAAQLRRRLLDSEFWPRIYKAVTGVDEWIDDIHDMAPRPGQTFDVTPQSLGRFAKIVWDPQRSRRAFQVKELILPINVAAELSCLPVAVFGESELFNHQEMTVDKDGKESVPNAVPLFIPRKQVSELRKAAPDLNPKPLLERAYKDLIQKAKEAPKASQQQVRFDPCYFQTVAFDVPVGLFNFAMKLGKAKEVYTYSISTAEPDELIANRVRNDLIRELGVQATMNNLTQSALSTEARVRAQDEMTKFLRFDSVQRSVFGYGRKASQAKIGWHVLPRDLQATEDGSDRPYLAPKQIPMTALVSLPAWWEKISLTVSRAWVDGQGKVTRLPDEDQGKPAYPIDLPTNFETLDASLFTNADSGPVLIDWQLPRLAVRPCLPFSVTLLGRRLWRSTVVTLAGERANRVLVMPNMNGIIATFERAPLPGNLSENDQGYYAQLTVWTSQGHVHLPRLIRFEPPLPQYAGKEACPKDGLAPEATAAQAAAQAAAALKAAPPGTTPQQPIPQPPKP